ncbi:MAG: MerR family transcriptional regulator [Candidatus Acidiferrum sp.]
MNIGTKEVYRAKEFASLAGVTVRALHHYDRLGLLRPKQRSEAGYRLYGVRDFARLEQIVVLKFLGIPLKQIRGLLEPDAKLADVLQSSAMCCSRGACNWTKRFAPSATPSGRFSPRKIRTGNCFNSS